ncbi:MAG: hypothetical protein HFF10_07445 [Angelakisella sp.]|jgi:hypothetical protein|nr:hypothetical protein [Angelakisella sp.]
MSVIQVEAAGQETLDRATRMLAGIDGGIEKAVQGAMSRAVAHLRANSTKAIRERYAISAANLRAEENIRVRYTYQGGVQAFVTFAGYKIPLYRYDGAAPAQPTQDTSEWAMAMVAGKWRRVHPSIAASGHQLKGTPPQQFQDAFTARMKSGHVGIFERTGGSAESGGDAIKELMGSSVPQMLGSPEVSEKLAQESMDKFEERLDHEVLRILNGWGR